MKFSYENLEIWQLGIKLVKLIYTLRNKFPTEDRFGLWDQLVRAIEAIPRDIAEGYSKKSKKERIIYIERAKSKTTESDTSFKEAVMKGRITEQEYNEKIKPLISELFFKLVGYQKWLSKRSDSPIPPSAAIRQFPQGFTLIEMLVSVAILGTVGLISTQIFFTTLRGAGKADIIREVKQNGDYALTAMERMIRNSVGVSSVCNGTTQSSLTIKNLDSNLTTFSLNAGPPGQIASNSGIFLTNNKVSVSGLSFTCLRVTGKPDVVNISFTIAQKDAGVSAEETSRLDFQTTVSLRTY